MEQLMKPLSRKRVDQLNAGLQGACEYMSDEKNLKDMSEFHDMAVDTLCSYKTNNRNHLINWGLRRFAVMDMDEYCNKNPAQCKYIDAQVNNMCKNKMDMNAVRKLACDMKFKTTCTDDDKCETDWVQSIQSLSQLGDKYVAACGDGSSKSKPFRDEYSQYACGKAPFFETHTNMKDSDIYQAVPFLRPVNDYVCNNLEQAIELGCQSTTAASMLAGSSGLKYLASPRWTSNRGRRQHRPKRGGQQKKFNDI